MIARRLTRRQRFGAWLLLAAIPLLVTGLSTAVLGGAIERTDEIPALVVNNDQMVQVTQPDGSTTPVLAGRLIVTELTGPNSPGFDWSLANTDSASEALQNGSAYAVVTIPQNFSASVSSLSGSNPVQATITITTDDAHSYLAGSLAQSLGGAMTSALGQQITEQYLTGLFQQLGTVGGSLSSAASGANSLADGTASLHDGLVTFSAGLDTATAGAQQYVNGVDQYSVGVDQLAAGTAQLIGATTELDSISSNVSDLAGGVTSYVDYVCAEVPDNAGLCNAGRTLQNSALQVQYGTALRINVVTSGIAELDAGAQQLAATSAALRSGGSSLVSGFDSLASAAQQTAEGAGSLASGARQLADGLSQGATQSNAAFSDPEHTATVVSQPVIAESTVLHPLESVRDLIALLIVPTALWLGALAVFATRNPFPQHELQSTTGTTRIIRRAAARGVLVGAVQVGFALLAAALVGVAPLALAAGALVALCASACFIGLHLLFKLLWPRAAGLVSAVLLVAQFVMLPGVVPVQMLPLWAQPVSQALPLTWATEAMQAAVSQTDSALIIRSAVALLLVGGVALGVATLLLSRRRLTAAAGFAVARAA